MSNKTQISLFIFISIKETKDEASEHSMSYVLQFLQSLPDSFWNTVEFLPTAYGVRRKIMFLQVSVF